MSTILIVNGSLRGAAGNTGRALARARRAIPAGVELNELVLADYQGTVEDLEAAMVQADALLVATGVYWGSWGSPLQRFLEITTSLEGTSAFLGKPAGVVVTMDSVGGSDVAQRLVGVLATLGCLIPPFPMVVLSRLASELGTAPGNEDVWQAEDIDALVSNLLLAAAGPTVDWRSWPILRTKTLRGTYPSSGALDLGLPDFGGPVLARERS